MNNAIYITIIIIYLIKMNMLELNVQFNMDHLQNHQSCIVLNIKLFFVHILIHPLIKYIMHLMANIYTMVILHLNKEWNIQYLVISLYNILCVNPLTILIYQVIHILYSIYSQVILKGLLLILLIHIIF